MAGTSYKDQKKNDDRYVIVALQGGGAMGAYQVGAYQALSEKGYEPDWVSGISIGAINASIIAGNHQKNRVPRLRQFWDIVAGNLYWWDCIPNYSEKLTNLWNVWLSMAGGVPGFFQPNFVPGPFAPPYSPEASCLYNTQKLKTTLQSLIDFDILNDYQSPTHVCLSLGATRVIGGVSETFESFGGPDPNNPNCRHTVITADHIMASGANAPWLPGVRINERLYWDGGMTSNSSFKQIIDHLADHRTAIGNRHIVVFVINLWGAYDREPQTFDEVCWRTKQIHYTSRIGHDMSYGKLFLDREWREKQAMSNQDGAEWTPQYDLVVVTYKCDSNEIPYGDALFSRTEINRRFEDGYAAMSSLLETQPSPWSLRGKDEKVKVHWC
jgi:NTE family protein